MHDSSNDLHEDLRPRGLKAIFIHLAGADPRVFTHLPPSEGSDYAKMGFTVLIPFILALTAGTFTLYTLQDTPKSLLVALPFGIVWALMILGMDVAIMSQLAKRLPPQPLPVVSGPRQAYGRPAQPPPAPVRGSDGGLRRFILALLRIMIAATLGLVMSHCLVLAIFKGRVQSQIEDVRTGMRSEIEERERPAVEKLQKQAATAARVQGLANRDQFLAAYNALQVDLGAATILDVPKQSGSLEGDGSIELTLKPYEAQISQLTTIADEKSNKALIKEKEIDRMKDELVQAEEAWRNERDGVPKNYTWYTPAFKAGMPTETSAKKGTGSRADFIRERIDDAKKIMEEHQSQLASLQQQAKAADEEVLLAGERKNAAKAKLLENNTTGIVEKINAYEAAQKATETKARGEIDRIVKDLTKKRDAAEAQYNTRVKPLIGASYDLLEQTEALHDLALGHNQASKGSKQWTILGLIILILVCLMFIDLTPLMMKLMHPPGHYDQWVARPPAPPESSASRRPDAYYNGAPPPSSSAGYSQPPPPPPPRRR